QRPERHRGSTAPSSRARTSGPRASAPGWSSGARSTRRGAPLVRAAERRPSGSEVAEPVLLPAGADAGLVVGGGPHGGREALAAPFGAAFELPRAGGVDEHAVPEPGAEAGHVAVGQGRARIDGRAEDAGEDHDAVLAGVHAVGEGPVDLLVGGR